MIKTDLLAEVADKHVIHDRYKDLAFVEQAFRTCKTGHLEVRPVYVRTEDHTKADVLVVMLAYMIVRELRRAWINLDITIEEGIKELMELCSTKMVVNGQTRCQIIAQPRRKSRLLLKAAGVKIPEALPRVEDAM